MRLTAMVIMRYLVLACGVCVALVVALTIWFALGSESRGSVEAFNKVPYWPENLPSISANVRYVASESLGHESGVLTCHVKQDIFRSWANAIGREIEVVPSNTTDPSIDRILFGYKETSPEFTTSAPGTPLLVRFQGKKHEVWAWYNPDDEHLVLAFSTYPRE